MNKREQEALAEYLRLSTSLKWFSKLSSELKPKDRIKLDKLINSQLTMYHAVLSSSLASEVSVEEKAMLLAMRDLKSNFKDESHFQATLSINHLTQSSLLEALKLELQCEAILDTVTEQIKPITRKQAKKYYQENIKKFQQPERRKAAHILITINNEFPENRRSEALKRIQLLKETINSENFGSLALRHSECPSALENGSIGWIQKEQLHPELDQILFELAANDISTPIETEIGFHLVWCQEVSPSHLVAFDQAEAKIIEQHLLREQKVSKKQWIQAQMERVVPADRKVS